MTPTSGSCPERPRATHAMIHQGLLCVMSTQLDASKGPDTAEGDTNLLDSALWMDREA